MVLRNDRVAPASQGRSPARSFLQATDNFYAPARDSRGEAAIRQGISDINSVLEERFVEERGRQRDDETQQGIADAIREQAGEELQGVRTGNILRQNSRWYMAGLNETRGQSAAAEFRRTMEVGYRDWEDRDNDEDGTLFRDWANGRLAELTASLGDNQYRLAGALPTAQNVVNNMASQHAAYTSRRLAAAARAAASGARTNIFEAVQRGEIAPEDAVAALAQSADEQYDLGNPAANDDMVEDAVTYARINDNPDILQTLLDSSQGWSQEQRLTLTDGIERVRGDITTAENFAERERAAAEEAARNASIQSVLPMIQDDPFLALSLDDFGGDIVAFNAARGVRDALQGEAILTDPQLTFGIELQARGDVMNAPDLPSALGVVSSLALRGPAYVGPAQDLLNEVRIQSEQAEVLNHPAVRTEEARLTSNLGAFGNQDYVQGDASLLATEGRSLYRNYIAGMAMRGEINGLNPVDVQNASVEASTYVVGELERRYPTMVRDRLLAQDGAEVGSALGFDAEVTEADSRERVVNAASTAIRNAEAAAEFQRLADEGAARLAAEAARPAPEGIADGTPEPTPEPTPDTAQVVEERRAAAEERAEELQRAAVINRYRLDELAPGVLGPAQLAELEQAFNLPLGTFTNVPDDELLANTLRLFLEAAQNQ